MGTRIIPSPPRRHHCRSGILVVSSVSRGISLRKPRHDDYRTFSSCFLLLLLSNFMTKNLFAFYATLSVARRRSSRKKCFKVLRSMHAILRRYNMHERCLGRVGSVGRSANRFFCAKYDSGASLAHKFFLFSTTS